MSGAQERRLGEAAAALAAGDYLAAERLCGEILARVPRQPRALHLAALARHGQGDDAGARELLRRSLDSDPHNLEAMKHLGAAELEAGNYLQAESWLRRAIALGGSDAAALCWLGLALSSQDRHAEAVDFFRQAVAAQPEDPGPRLNLGNALMRSGAPEPAIASFEEALRLKPDYTEALNSLGRALAERGNCEEAMERLSRALALRPDYAEAHDNLGEALLRLGREEEAADCFRRAIGLRPENAEFRCDLGNALAAQQRWEEAINQYERAVALDPALYEAQYSLAVARLFRHEFERAWSAYEWRLRSRGFRSAIRKNPGSVDLYERLPRWAGPAEAGAGEVAIWAEQGIGDQVLFSTLIPELIGTGVPFVYETDGRLVAAYGRAFPGARFVAQEDPPHGSLTRASRVLAAGSLPGLFRHSRADFARQPGRLLAARPDRVAYYRERFVAVGTSLKVALSWRTARQKWWLTRKKSTALMSFAPLLRLSGVQFVDVQYGDTAAERGAVEQALGVRLARFEEVDYFNDLEELLAILEACDLVITTSNATAHFAGALGKRTWLMYLADRAPFHYWAHAGDHRCLWYPSVEIVSAPQLTEWDALARYVAGKLERELRAA
jgi:tetratricopeptide (TPR) repeat protein